MFLRLDSLLVQMSEILSEEIMWKTSSRRVFSEILSLRLCISKSLAFMKGLKLVAFFSKDDIMQVESPRHETEMNPPVLRDTTLAMSLVHNRSPDNSDLGIVSPVFRGVTQALAMRM